MAKLITAGPVKMGVVYNVANNDRKGSEKKYYKAINVEDEDGGNERWLLLTEAELAGVPEVQCEQLAGQLKSGRLVPMQFGKVAKRLVKLAEDEEEKVLLMKESLVNKGEARAKANPEDLPKKSHLRDLFD